MPKGRRKTLKGARAWRKIDQGAVADASFQRNEDVLSGGNVADKSQDSLFSIEKKKKVPVVMPLDPEKRKAAARSKTSRLDDLIAPNPHTKAEGSGTTPAPMVTYKKKRNFETMVNAVKEGKKKLPEPFDPRSEEAQLKRAPIKAVPIHSLVDTHVKMTPTGVFDLWEEREEELKKYQEFYDEHGYDEDFYQPMAKRPKLYSREYSKPSVRPAIEVDTAGASYNPEYDAHQELLAETLEYYTRKAATNRMLHRRMPVMKSQPEPMVYVESEEEEEEEDQNQDDMEPEAPKVNLAHIPRKTQQERNKEARRRAHELHMAKLAARKFAKAQWKRLDEIVAEVSDDEKISQAKSEARKELREMREATKIRRLGRAHYQHPEPMFLLTEELPGSYRKLKPAASVLEDRFRSLQRRNIIEARTKSSGQRNTNRKMVTRYGFKDDWIE